jgi:hypothetical protein
MDTPPHIVAAAVAALGAVDLFVASDALSRPWSGRIFVQPPYGRAIGAWVAKLLAEYETGSVSAFVVLLPARTDTAWFHAFFEHSPRICFIRGRLHFGGAKGGAPFPSCAVYCGPDKRAFVKAFDSLGFIIEGWPS